MIEKELSHFKSLHGTDFYLADERFHSLLDRLSPQEERRLLSPGPLGRNFAQLPSGLHLGAHPGDRVGRIGPSREDLASGTQVGGDTALPPFERLSDPRWVASEARRFVDRLGEILEVAVFSLQSVPRASKDHPGW